MIGVSLVASDHLWKVWENQTGYSRHSYAVSGSFTNFQPVTMEMDCEQHAHVANIGKACKWDSPKGAFGKWDLKPHSAD